MKLYIALVLISFCPIPVMALDANLQASYDSNLVNSPDGNEALSALVLDAEVGNQLSVIENTATALDAFGMVGLSVPLAYSNLATLRGELGASYHWQKQRGFRAPWYSLTSSIGLEIGQYQHQRALDLGISLTRSKRLTDKVLLSQVVQYRHMWDDRSQVSGGMLSGTVVADWALNQTLALYVQPSFGYGRFESTYTGSLAQSSMGSRSGHLPSEVDTSNPSSSDYFLNEALSDSLDEDWYSYGIDAILLSNVIGLNKRVSQEVSLDVAYRFSLVDNDSLSYFRHQVFASLLAAW